MRLAPVGADEFPLGRAHITAAPPQIDGVLDDPAWDQAAPADQFFQREPDEGAPATERTQVRILRDDDQIYIGFRCFDAEPDQIIATVMRRDDDIENDDNVQVILDTYDDRRGGFFFSTNPLGARLDMLLSAEGRPRTESWDCVWQALIRSLQARYKDPIRTPKRPERSATAALENLNRALMDPKGTLMYP